LLVTNSHVSRSSPFHFLLFCYPEMEAWAVHRGASERGQWLARTKTSYGYLFWLFQRLTGKLRRTSPFWFRSCCLELSSCYHMNVIFKAKMSQVSRLCTKLSLLEFSRGTRGNPQLPAVARGIGVRNCSPDLTFTHTGSQDDVS